MIFATDPLCANQNAYLLPNLESSKGQLIGTQGGFWRISEFVFPEEFMQEREILHLTEDLCLG